jgi:hypothetical protein
MAVYRLHRNNWEKGLAKVIVRGKKRRQEESHETLIGQKEASRLSKTGVTTSKVEGLKSGNEQQWWTELGS